MNALIVAVAELETSLFDMIHHSSNMLTVK